MNDQELIGFLNRNPNIVLNSKRCTLRTDSTEFKIFQLPRGGIAVYLKDRVVDLFWDQDEKSFVKKKKPKP
jgi:hypothetical protein